MKPVAYILCLLVCLVCAVMLLRGYFRGGNRLLLWSGICFAGLTVSNILVFLDLVVYPDVDLYLWRETTAAVSMLILLFGMIWEGE